MHAEIVEKMVQAKLEILLDSATVVLKNQPDCESQKVNVRGQVALYVRKGLSVNAVKITLEGVRKIAWMTDSMTPVCIKQRETVLLLQQTLFETYGGRLPGTRFKPGVYRWPFSFPLDPKALPETVERLESTYVKYNVSATVYTGILSKHLYCKEQINIIKTPPLPGPELNFLPQQIHQDVWAEKLSYTISLQDPYTYIGRSIPINFRLTPLQRGLQIGKIRLDLVEEVLLILFKDGEPWRSHRSKKSVLTTTTAAEPSVIEKRRSTAVCHANDDPEHDHNEHNEEPVELDEGLEDEALSFRVELPVPREPYVAVQDIDSERIKARHLLYIMVELINADNHASELTMKFRPKLYIPIPNVAGVSATLWSTESSTPPSYGQHLLDLLCSDSMINEPPLPPPPTSLVRVDQTSDRAF